MIYVTKIKDKDCEICQHMSKHDRPTFESFDGVNYDELELDDLVSGSPVTKKQMALTSAVEKYAINPDYTLDLPTYIVLDDNFQYLTHLTGANTVREIRSAMDGVKISSTV